MRTRAMSRRTALEMGLSTLAAAAIPGVVGAHAGTGLSPKSVETIRKYYAAWETRDWHPIDILLADSFQLERVIGNGDEAFVMYVGRTKNGKTFRNVEYFRLRDAKVEAIECYFGAPSSFPSAASAA